MNDFDKLGDRSSSTRRPSTVFVVYTRLQGLLLRRARRDPPRRRVDRRPLPPEPGPLHLDEPPAPRHAADVHGLRRRRPAGHEVAARSSRSCGGKRAAPRRPATPRSSSRTAASASTTSRRTNLNELSGSRRPDRQLGLPAFLVRAPRTAARPRDERRRPRVVREPRDAHAAGHPPRASPTTSRSLSAPTSLLPAQRDALARGHTPIGRVHRTRLPTRSICRSQTPVGTVISPAGVPTFYWSHGHGPHYLRGGAASQRSSRSRSAGLPRRPRARGREGHVRHGNRRFRFPPEGSARGSLS